MKVKLLNVKYSPNVGDGLLVECLEQNLRNVDGMQGASSVDLAGRSAYSQSARQRETMMWLLESAPNILRPVLARAGLEAKLSLGLRDHYKSGLSGADAVVIGGGNLISDHDLNFPLKLAAALKEAARFKSKVAIYGCGVSSGWSVTGKKIMRAALRANPPVHVSVRDEASKRIWDQLFSETADAEAAIVNDPGVLASQIYRFDSSSVLTHRPIAAVGLMSTVAIQYHGFKSLSSDSLVEWYLRLIDDIVDRGFDVSLFTNGSPEDQRFALKLWSMLSQHRRLSCMRMMHVSLPIDLCQVVANADVVVAFRMHALIAAYSYGKPIIALRWDPKVDAFLQSVGLADCIVDANTCSPKEAVMAMISALESGIDQKTLEGTMSKAKSGIHQLAQSLKLERTE